MAGTEEPSAAQATEVATAVGTAAAQSAEAGETADETRARATSAARTAAERVKLEISDEDLNRIVDGMIGRMQELGAFDAPPAPEPSPQPPASAEEPPPASVPAEPVEPPRKKSWAEKYAGL
jgi:hypothetical protein